MHVSEVASDKNKNLIGFDHKEGTPSISRLSKKTEEKPLSPSSLPLIDFFDVP
jgi:hypothetical protein